MLCKLIYYTGNTNFLKRVDSLLKILTELQADKKYGFFLHLNDS